jgi:hypothetical protein
MRSFAVAAALLSSLPSFALSASNATVPASALSAANVADYQVALWTSVLIGAILLSVIYFMLHMDSLRDPQLYAQLVDARAAGPPGGKAASAAAR